MSDVTSGEKTCWFVMRDLGRTSLDKSYYKQFKDNGFEAYTPLKWQLVVKNGKRVMDRVSIDEIKKYVQDQLTDNIWEEEQRFENPHNHYLDMSPAYYDMKMSLLHKLTD